MLSHALGVLVEEAGPLLIFRLAESVFLPGDRLRPNMRLEKQYGMTNDVSACIFGIFFTSILSI